MQIKSFYDFLCKLHSSKHFYVNKNNAMHFMQKNKIQALLCK